MIIQQRHLKFNGKVIVSHIAFQPPLVVASELNNHACFIFPINAKGNIIRTDGKVQVAKDQGVLMKCGTYINKWYSLRPKINAEVVIVRLTPELIQSAIDTKTMAQIQSQLKKKRSTAVVEINIVMQKYLESLFFYFENPSLVTDELIELKIKELTFLLANINESNPILELLSRLFDKEKFGLEEIIEANLYEDLSLDELASLAKMSTPTFKRKFKEALGESPGKYIRNKRLETSTEWLKGTKKTISEIAFDLGYNDPNYFSKAFRQRYGISPTEYRNN